MTDEAERRLVVNEYFAGIGLARIGLEEAGYRVAWSNDISAKKHKIFRGHFGSLDGAHRYVLGDLGKLSEEQVPSGTDLAWASFPCTDLSIAGTRAGLHKGATSSFWLFVKSLARLGPERPPVIALENVSGFATSGGGKDIRTAIQSLNGLGYSIDVISLDARRFVPQSRPRLFLIGRLGEPEDDPTPSELRPSPLDSIFEDSTLRTFRATLPSAPALLNSGFSSMVDQFEDSDPRWWSTERVEKFVASLSDIQSARLQEFSSRSGETARTAYRRMRNGVPRWEIRPDDIAGCLRTARGGSSRQAVVSVRGGHVRVRWMTPREYAKLMGAPEYLIDGATDNEVYSGFGDAVCVPAVRWLAENCLQARIGDSSLSSETPKLKMAS